MARSGGQVEQWILGAKFW